MFSAHERARAGQGPEWKRAKANLLDPFNVEELNCQDFEVLGRRVKQSSDNECIEIDMDEDMQAHLWEQAEREV